MTPASESRRATVIVIDDDQSVREALQGLFGSVGLGVRSYGSVREYLSADQPDHPGCMVIDIRLPGRSGLDFQDDMVKAGIWRPLILISAHADIPMSVRAMKAGAVEFLTKPVRDQDLLDAVRLAVDLDFARRQHASLCNALEARYDTLTQRERQVMALVVTGQRNKQMAACMAVTEATVKLHRGHVMRKMGAQSVAELVRMADAVQHGKAKMRT